MGRVVIDGNAVYEIDEKCVKRKEDAEKKKQEQKKEQKTEQTTSKKEQKKGCP